MLSLLHSLCSILFHLSLSPSFLSARLFRPSTSLSHNQQTNNAVPRRSPLAGPPRRRPRPHGPPLCSLGRRLRFQAQQQQRCLLGRRRPGLRRLRRRRHPGALECEWGFRERVPPPWPGALRARSPVERRELFNLGVEEKKDACDRSSFACCCSIFLFQSFLHLPSSNCPWSWCIAMQCIRKDAMRAKGGHEKDRKSSQSACECDPFSSSFFSLRLAER